VIFPQKALFLGKALNADNLSQEVSHENRLAIHIVALVGGPFSGLCFDLYRRASDRRVSERVNMNRWLPQVLFPRPGWFILHAIIIALVFCLGYSIKF
jgi:hypothetical protein